jgi:hypothetical protein
VPSSFSVTSDSPSASVSRIRFPAASGSVRDQHLMRVGEPVGIGVGQHGVGADQLLEGVGQAVRVGIDIGYLLDRVLWLGQRPALLDRVVGALRQGSGSGAP